LTPGSQQIRFCTAPDGVRLAYATVGKGPPLVRAAHWMTHLEFDWESPVWRPWLTELSRHNTLVRYDPRGCGLSDRDVGDMAFDAWVADLETVVAAAGLARFALLGASQSVSVAIAYAAKHPQRVSRLILYGGFARGRLRRGSPVQAEEAEVQLKLTNSAGAATTRRSGSSSPPSSSPMARPSSSPRSTRSSACRRPRRTPRGSCRCRAGSTWPTSRRR